MKEVKVEQVHIDDAVDNCMAHDICGCAIHEAVADELELKNEISFHEITLHEGEPESESYLCTPELGKWQRKLIDYTDYKWGVMLEKDMREEWGDTDMPDPITVVFDDGQAYIKW